MQYACTDCIENADTCTWRMNALKCRTLGATLAQILENACAIETLTTECAISESAHAIEMTCNGKYMEDFGQKTEKEARCHTSSLIPGSV